ncbi:MAG: glycosyltransferase family 9 protein [Magnetospirillum sp.]|nr:glycosyltransferase family 9 protein [Magnetospirillum sp.]
MNFRLLFDTALRQLYRAIPGRPHRRGVILVSSGGIGDTILFSAAAPYFARLAEPGEAITVVTQAASAAVGFLLPPGFTQFPVNYRKFQRNRIYRALIGWRISRLSARLCIATDYLRHPLVDDAFVFFSDAPRRIGLEPKPWPKYVAALRANLAFYDTIVPITHAPMHRYMRWLHLATALAGESLPVRPIGGAVAGTREHPTECVVFHPFASTRTRQPPAELFVRLLDRLPPGYRAVLSCGPGDLDRNPDFVGFAGDPRVTIDATSLAEKTALLARASLVVSVDTSVMHLAAILGTPTLCIASAAHVIDSVPYDPRMNAGNVRFILADVDCAGCLGNCNRAHAGERYPCVDAIGAETVEAAMRDALNAPEVAD